MEGEVSDSSTDANSLEEGGSDNEKEVLSSGLQELSFEKLQELKAHLGVKHYNERILKKDKQRMNKFDHIKRENKNRPREMSSKINVNKQWNKPKKVEVRDPRFDSLCGAFKPEEFKKNYKFVSRIKRKEKKLLANQLSEEKDPERKDKIKYLLERQENQEREARRIRLSAKKKKEEKVRIKQMMADGKKPYFPKKSEKRAKDLLEKYEELRTSGKIRKHLKKTNKKNRILPVTN